MVLETNPKTVLNKVGKTLNKLNPKPIEMQGLGGKNVLHLNLGFDWGKTYWVNLGKRGGKDRVFQGLAGLLQEISRGQSPREIPHWNS